MFRHGHVYCLRIFKGGRSFVSSRGCGSYWVANTYMAPETPAQIAPTTNMNLKRLGMFGGYLFEEPSEYPGPHIVFAYPAAGLQARRRSFEVRSLLP